jgi:hypothetical protein
MDLATALSRVQMDYLEMPGLILTLEQGRRLWALPVDICQAALDTLAATGFLVRTGDGKYVRGSCAPVHIQVVDVLTWVTGNPA